MSPPAIIIAIIWPVLTMERKEISVRTVPADISPFVIFRIFVINTLPVHPFIKRTTVIENSVQNDPHSTAVYLLHQPGK